MNLIKILSVCSVKGIAREIKSQITGRERLLATQLSETGL